MTWNILKKIEIEGNV